MRLDANNPNARDYLYNVYDCDLMKYRLDVVWVDDTAKAYGMYGSDRHPDNLVVESADILIMPEQMIVIINPKLNKDELLELLVIEQPMPKMKLTTASH